MYGGQHSAAVVSGLSVKNKRPYCGAQDVNSFTVVQA